MNQSHKFQELNWRRPLTEAEQAELRTALAKNPEALAEMESENRLTQLLGKLPDAPVSSNFTARVLKVVELESKRTERDFFPRWMVWLRSGWIPKVTFASFLVCSGLFSYHRHNVVRRENIARDVATISAVAAVSNPEDLDAILHLDKGQPDLNLLALLK